MNSLPFACSKDLACEMWLVPYSSPEALGVLISDLRGLEGGSTLSELCEPRASPAAKMALLNSGGPTNKFRRMMATCRQEHLT